MELKVVRLFMLPILTVLIPCASPSAHYFLVQPSREAPFSHMTARWEQSECCLPCVPYLIAFLEEVTLLCRCQRSRHCWQYCMECGSG